MSKSVLNQVNLVCGDVGASIAFYRKLGVEIPESGVWSTSTGPHHVGARARSGDEAADLDLDSTAFAQLWNPSWKGRSDLGGRVVLGFGVSTREEVDAVFREMVGAGYRALQQPHDAFWGARYAMIEDPDGVAVGLMSPVSPDRKSPPPPV